MSREALWGYNGFIGSRIRDDETIPVLHGGKFSLPGTPFDNSFDSVIWCAGFAGIKNVDDVQRNPLRSRLQNVWEPLEVAQRCYKYGKRLLMFSSGCIYDKLNKDGLPHVETDAPNFISTVYLADKWEMEQRLLAIFPDVTVFRIRVPFDSSKHPRNSLHKLARFPAVWNVNQSFTWLPDLKKAVQAWKEGRINGGVWHVVQPDVINNYEGVSKYLNPQVGCITGNLHEVEKMACPRSAAILNCSKLQQVISLTPVEEAWQIACREYVA